MKRWIPAKEFTGGCSYTLPTALVCAAPVAEGKEWCQECLTARSQKAMFARGKTAMLLQRWLTLEQFIDEAKQYQPICSYVPIRGADEKRKNHVCGAPAINTLTEPDYLKWRCSFCLGKGGGIALKMKDVVLPAPAPPAPPAPFPKSETKDTVHPLLLEPFGSRVMVYRENKAYHGQFIIVGTSVPERTCLLRGQRADTAFTLTAPCGNWLGITVSQWSTLNPSEDFPLDTYFFHVPDDPY